MLLLQWLSSFSELWQLFVVRWLKFSEQRPMRRAPIFYQMFQRSLQLLFNLIGDRSPNAAGYRFDSVAVKEPRFAIVRAFQLIRPSVPD